MSPPELQRDPGPGFTRAPASAGAGQRGPYGQCPVRTDCCHPHLGPKGPAGISNGRRKGTDRKRRPLNGATPKTHSLSGPSKASPTCLVERHALGANQKHAEIDLENLSRPLPICRSCLRLLSQDFRKNERGRGSGLFVHPRSGG
jgi:hypothetical protein